MRKQTFFFFKWPPSETIPHLATKLRKEEVKRLTKINTAEMRAVEGGKAYYTYCGAGKFNAVTVRVHKTFCSLCQMYCMIGNPVNGNKTYCYYK